MHSPVDRDQAKNRQFYNLLNYHEQSLGELRKTKPRHEGKLQDLPILPFSVL